MKLIKKVIHRIKNLLKHFLPPSSKTVNSRLDRIERQCDAMGNMFYLMCKAQEVHTVHQDTFLKFKNINIGKEVVLIGAGPTLNDYEPIKDAIHIGINGTYHKKGLDLDYYFIQDFEATQEGGPVSLDELRALNCQKFIGNYIHNRPKGLGRTCFPKHTAEYIGAKTYFVRDFRPQMNYILSDSIEFFPLMDNGSTIFSALQFAIYTHPKKLYIVGCDCSRILGQHFDGYRSETSRPLATDRIYNTWKFMKNWLDLFYPDIEVISVNPIGLRGVFNDIYTKKYDIFQDGQNDANDNLS